MIKNEKDRLIRGVGLLFSVSVITFVLSYFIALGAKGLDVSSVFDQFNFYFNIGAIGLIGLSLALVLETLITKDDKKYGSYLFFSSPGETPLGLLRGMSQIQLAWLSIITIVPLGVVAVTKNITFTGIASLEQQFTPVSQLLFSITLVPGAENLAFALFLSAIVILFRIFARKIKMSKENFRILLPTIVILFGAIAWRILHLLRYAGQDLSLLIVLGFGAMMAISAILSGSFIPAWILHLTNNFFYDAKRIFASDVVIINTLVIISILAIGYYFVYRGRLLGGVKKKGRG